jgi:hypothetical protein
MQEDRNADTEAARAMIEKRGYRTYSLETTNGNICAALNVKAGDMQDFESRINNSSRKRSIPLTCWQAAVSRTRIR